MGSAGGVIGDVRSFRGLRANGEEFPIEASISHIEVGGQPGYTIILRDVTDRKRAEEQILQLNAHLEQRVRERTQELSAAEPGAGIVHLFGGARSPGSVAAHRCVCADFARGLQRLIARRRAELSGKHPPERRKDEPVGG